LLNCFLRRVLISRTRPFPVINEPNYSGCRAFGLLTNPLMTGQKLRLLREFRNYSQEYIAEKLGITQNAYSRIENNQARLTADRLEKLAAILEITPMELLSEREPVIYFSDVPVAPAPEKDGHWKEMIESTRQLYGQVICSKDEKIAHLETEISFLRKEKDRIMRLLEKITDVTPFMAVT
jgi:transcriptional regulator with XRE-family HTH domain